MTGQETEQETTRQERPAKLDLPWLTSWVGARHLAGDSLRAYRRAFRSHPARLLILKSFLQDGMAERVGRFLSLEVDFQTTYGLHSVDDRWTDEGSWRNAKEDDRFFKFGRLAEVPHEFRLSPNLIAFLELRAAIRDSRFKTLLEEITGLALGGSTPPHVNAFKQGDYLKPHDDHDFNRRLTLVLYLSRDWIPEFGGALHMIDSTGNETKIDVEYNSLVAFDVAAGTKHFIAPIAPAAGDRSRLTIGCWYYGRRATEAPSPRGDGSRAGFALRT